MIKGVNRRIIEVQEIGNSCFDKAIFFVKSDFCNKDERELEKEARKIVKQYNVCDLPQPAFKIAKKEKYARHKNIFRSVFSAIIGAFILYIVQSLI